MSLRGPLPASVGYSFTFLPVCVLPVEMLFEEAMVNNNNNNSKDKVIYVQLNIGLMVVI